MEQGERHKQFQNSFKDVPHPFDKVKYRLFSEVLNGDLGNEFYGLTDETPFYRIYHATVDTKLPNISKDGLRAFLNLIEIVHEFL